MNITPHLGIGDLLVVKWKEISNKLEIKQININLKLIKEYSRNYENKLRFTSELVAFLFPYCDVNLVSEGPCNFQIFDHYSLNQTYLYNHVNCNIVNFDNKYNDYIIFHTKCRDDQVINMYDKILPSLNAFLDNFKTTRTILILGEKFIGDNYETRIVKPISLYDNFLRLKNNNNVIDLTLTMLTDGNESFDSFLYDIELINKAMCNVTFGIGGPCNLCKAFSERNVSFMPFHNLSPYKNTLYEMMNANNSLTENIEELNARINYFCGLRPEPKT
jgi:hypothetical protein